MKIYETIEASIIAGLVSTQVVDAAVNGEFTMLSYNVAGLGLGLSSAESDRQEAHEIISCYINEFDIVHVQEDFNYHAALYDTCNDHPYRSPTSGGMVFGSGLNSLSYFPMDDLDRITWNDRNGADALTPKGFTFTTVRVDEGAYIHLYNAHAQAANEETDQEYRRRNMIQMADHINANSAGWPVIIAGDINARYTRAEDNIRNYLTDSSLFEDLFLDAWVEDTRDGVLPAVGGALVCDPQVTSPNCEIVDKIIYRGNGYLNLNVESYVLRQDDLTPDGLRLSDHPPIVGHFQYTSPSNVHQTDMLGGTGGEGFTSIDQVVATGVELTSITIQGGARVDAISFSYSNGETVSAGGSGGDAYSLTLESGEHFVSGRYCEGERNGGMRIFYAEFTTNLGREVSGGVETNSCMSVTREGWKIAGGFGEAVSELDRFGVIWTTQ